MMQSFNNALRRLFFMILVDPRIMSLLTSILLSLSVLIIDNLVIDCALLFLALLCFVCSCVQPLFRRHLTPNFYCVHCFGVKYIYEKKNARKKDIRKNDFSSCQEILRYEIDNLPLRLPEGRYAAITHEFIIQILMKNNIPIQSCIPAFEKDLRIIQNSMFSCKDCDLSKACRIRDNGSEIKHFYYIKFKIKREEQPNLVR